MPTKKTADPIKAPIVEKPKGKPRGRAGGPPGHAPYPGCETGGRPQVYTKEYIENEADEFLKWMKDPAHIYFKRFALDRGYSPQRLSEFAENNDKFSEVYKRAKEWQECRLAEGGLLEEFNSGFCKFVMGNVCGWTDRQETKLSGDAQNPLLFLIQKADGESKDLVNDEA